MIARDESYWAFGLGVMTGLSASLALSAAVVWIEGSREAERPRFLEPKCTTVIQHTVRR
jgi:hypothetical protein